MWKPSSLDEFARHFLPHWRPAAAAPRQYPNRYGVSPRRFRMADITACCPASASSTAVCPARPRLLDIGARCQMPRRTLQVIRYRPMVFVTQLSALINCQQRRHTAQLRVAEGVAQPVSDRTCRYRRATASTRQSMCRKTTVDPLQERRPIEGDFRTKQMRPCSGVVLANPQAAGRSSRHGGPLLRG